MNKICFLFTLFLLLPFAVSAQNTTPDWQVVVYADGANALKVANSVRWYAKQPGYVFDAEAARFQKLRIGVTKAYFVVLHPLIEHGSFAAIAPGLHFLPGFPENSFGFTIFERSRKFYPASSGFGVIGKELGTVVLC